MHSVGGLGGEVERVGAGVGGGSAGSDKVQVEVEGGGSIFISQVGIKISIVIVSHAWGLGGGAHGWRPAHQGDGLVSHPPRRAR